MTASPKNQHTSIAALLAIAFLAISFAGCENNVTEKDIEEQKQNVNNEQDKLEALKERQDVEDKIESKLTTLAKEVEQLKQQADDATGDEEVQLRGEIAKLQTKHEHAQDRLKELRAASGDKWAQLKIKTEEAWEDASDSVKEKVKQWKERSAKGKSDEASDEDTDDSQSTEPDSSK